MQGIKAHNGSLNPVGGPPCRHVQGRVVNRTGRVAVLFVLFVFAITAGCTRIHTEKGVDPTWHDVNTDDFRAGITTQSEVMALLGPPSQIITDQEGTIFYYLHEEAVGTGIILILYNQSHLNTRYDRAIFFFDANGVLREYAFNAPANPAK